MSERFFPQYGFVVPLLGASEIHLLTVRVDHSA
jgi:hypothetical protein